MNARFLLSAALLAFPALSFGQTGYTITGAMSNFDCSNHCDYPCDEMEIQIEGVRPEDVLHTYTNGNYGPPTVTLSADGASTIVDYRNPQHLTAVNSIEHFGVTIRGAAYYVPAPYHPTTVHWYRNGHIATVNGQVPTVAGGTAPATQPLQPSISATVTPGSHGTGGVSLTVTNNDPVQSIWIKRRAQITASAVTLEALMSNDPIITTSVQIDPSPIKLGPSQSLTASRDLIEVEEAQSAVFSAQYYQNIISFNPDPFGGGNTEVFGPELGNIMTATQASPVLPCVHHPAGITTQPVGVTQAANTRVDLRVQARGDDNSPLQYAWMKEGVPLAEGNGFSGTTTAHLRIDSLTAATEGFYSVLVTNTCISTLSQSALVFITGHNEPPLRPATPAGCNPADIVGIGGTPPADGLVTGDDFNAFIAAFAAGDTLADIVGIGGAPPADGLVTGDDFNAFIAAFVAGCP